MIDRIRQILSISGLSETQFAKKIGVPQNTLWRQLNDRSRKLSLETVLAVLNTFKDIDSNWLLRGEGDMLLVNSNQDKRMDSLVDVIAMQQEVIKNLQDKIKQLQNK